VTPTQEAEARKALAAHDHDPAMVCPECCTAACDPCVDGLRVVLAVYDTLTNGVISALTLPDGEPVTRDPVKLATYAAEQLSAEVAMVGRLTANLVRLLEVITRIGSVLEAAGCEVPAVVQQYPATMAGVVAERDRLRDLLRCERGEWAPEGWTWERQSGHTCPFGWNFYTNRAMPPNALVYPNPGGGVGWRAAWAWHVHIPNAGGFAESALEAIEAAADAARGKS
jgi:hypothetical protein